MMLAALLLLSCTASSDVETGSVSASVAPVAPASSSNYSLDLEDGGSDDRRELVAPVPVGRSADVTVSLSSLDETVDILLRAEVVTAGADGEAQLVELVVVGVEADDPATVDGLRPIVGSSASIVRDERLAVVEQQLDVPSGLGFRADAVARQALRAPFALVGPLPLEPVGSGARWVIQTTDDEGLVVEELNVELSNNSDDGFHLRFDVSDGVAEIWGRPGALLPDEQVIALGNATLRVVAERSN